MLDNQQIQNNWPKIKSHVLSHWSKLSEDEVENTHGNVNSLGKLIESAYGGKDNFDTEYERLCHSIINTTPTAQYTSKDPRVPSSKKEMKTNHSVETEVSITAMDKDRDDMYLSGPNSVTRKAEIKDEKDTNVMSDLSANTLGEEGFNDPMADGFNNVDRSTSRFAGDPGHELEEEILKPDLKGMNAETMMTPMREYKEHRNSEHKNKHKTKKHKTANSKPASDEFTPNQAPQHFREDITLGRSNSSANTTSPSALTSSAATSKDTKKL